MGSPAGSVALRCGQAGTIWADWADAGRGLSDRYTQLPVLISKAHASLQATWSSLSGLSSPSSQLPWVTSPLRVPDRPPLTDWIPCQAQAGWPWLQGSFNCTIAGSSPAWPQSKAPPALVPTSTGRGLGTLHVAITFLFNCVLLTQGVI